MEARGGWVGASALAAVVRAAGQWATWPGAGQKMERKLRPQTSRTDEDFSWPGEGLRVPWAVGTSRGIFGGH